MKRLLLAVTLCLLPIAAFAQTDAAPVQSGWYSLGRSANLAVDTSGESEAFAANGLVARICNAGSIDAYVSFGGSSATATVAGSSLLKAGFCAAYPLKANQGASPATYIAGITGSSSTTLYVETGSGSAPQSGGNVTATISGTVSSNTAQVNGAIVNVGTGAASTGTQRVTTSTDSTIATITNPVTAAQATAANLNATVVGTGTLAVQNTAATPAGANLIGAVSTGARYDATPTVTNGAYAAGNDIGGLVSFTLARTASGLLQSVGIQFQGGATTTIYAYCFDANPTGSTFNDKGTFTIAAADEAKQINKTGIALTPAVAANSGTAVTSTSIDQYAQPFNSTGTIYCGYVASAIFTPASIMDMRVNIKTVQSAQ